MPLTIHTTGITFMTSGRTMFSRIVLILSLWLAANLSADDNTLMMNKENQLQQLLLPYKNIKTIKLSYNEKRFSLFLKKPKEYKGLIEYTRPDIFIKQMLSPERKKYIINKQQLLIYNKDVTQTLSLDDYPQLKQIKALFSALLQGNASELTRYYQYTISPMSKVADNNRQYRLILKSAVTDPFTQENPTMSQHIEIIFQDDAIKKIIMYGPGGERTEMQLTTLLLEKDKATAEVP